MASATDPEGGLYKCLKWAFLILLIIQAIIVIIGIIVISVIFISADSGEANPNTYWGSLKWGFRQVPTFIRILLYVYAVVLLIAKVIGIIGSLRESFWLVLICIIIEGVVGLGLTFSVKDRKENGLIVLAVFVVGLIWLILMGLAGKHKEGIMGGQRGDATPAEPAAA